MKRFQSQAPACRYAAMASLGVLVLSSFSIAQRPSRLDRTALSTDLAAPPATDVVTVAGSSAAGCPPGEIPDCNGTCAPDFWPGDGFCDNGDFTFPLSEIGAPQIFFNCAEFCCDAGDCLPSQCGPSGCGDGVLLACEGCDDGNTISGDGCSSTCENEGSVATYSVHHMVGEDVTPNGPWCFELTDPAFPGALDDILDFDELLEPLATDIVGTVVSVIESETVNPDGTITVSITTTSPPGTDMFPSGFLNPDPKTLVPLTGACWFIGIDDHLDRDPPLTVQSATLTFRAAGTPVLGPTDATSLFVTSPWDGFLGVWVAEGAGQFVTEVQLDIVYAAGTCGNGACDAGETCDTCSVDCGACPSSCPGTGECCVGNGTPGCSDSACCELVCADDPFCCGDDPEGNGTWDGLCAELAVTLCAGAPSCPIACPGTGDCCAIHAGLGCDDASCCSLVCEFDTFCCAGTWDAICVSEAAVLCGEKCPTGACCLDDSCPVPGTCEQLKQCGVDCECFELAEGGTGCVTGGDCAALVPCPNGTSDCPIGQGCYINTCCGEPVCAPDCGAASPREPQSSGGLRMSRALPSVDTSQRGVVQSCIEEPEGFCTPVGGTYQGDGTTCADVDVCSCSASATLMDTSYACDDSLPRVGRHVLRFFFDGPIEAPMPGEIEIRELKAGGAFGDVDLSPFFQFTVEGTSVLRVEEHGCSDGVCDFGSSICSTGPSIGRPCTKVFSNERWYAVMNRGGWCETAEFQIHYVAVRGDANNTLTTGFTDLSAIRAAFADPSGTPDDSRFDINTVGGTSFTDLSAARAFLNSTGLNTKPDRHTCTPLP